jgi:hypothetical protein
MAQTSVDFLWRWWMDNPFASYEEGVEAYRKAKEMHKKEIEEAYNHRNITTLLGRLLTSEQYYNETFNK